MSTLVAEVETIAAPVTGLRSRADVGRLKVTPPRVVRSEWSKFASLRSSWVTIVVALAIIAGVAAMATGVAAGDVAQPTGPNGGGGGGGFASDPTRLSLAGAGLVQIILGILGILGALAAFFVGRAILGDGANAALSDTGVFRAVLGTGAYMAAIAMLGLAIGALLRHAAGAIGTLFAVLLLAPGLLPAVLPTSWADVIVKYLPSNAGSSFSSVVPADGLLSAGLP